MPPPRYTTRKSCRRTKMAYFRRCWVNPFRAPEPLPMLNPSNFVPKNGFPVVKALRSPRTPPGRPPSTRYQVAITHAVKVKALSAVVGVSRERRKKKRIPRFEPLTPTLVQVVYEAYHSSSSRPRRLPVISARASVGTQ